ncbi:L,D-transpeptidase family protein [Nitratifractor sp.]
MDRFKRFFITIAVGLLVQGVLSAGPLDFDSGSANTSFVDKVSTALEKRLKNASYPGLDRLYKELFYTPVWIGRSGPTPFARTLLRQIEEDRTIPPVLELGRDARSLGEELKRIYGGKRPLRDKVEAELKVSRLYLNYMHYLLYGGIDWKAFDEKRAELEKKYDAKVGWDYYRPKMTPTSLLVEATMNGDLGAAFRKAEPTRYKYAQLKRYLVRYLTIAQKGGWKNVPSFKVIKPGQRHPAIPAIRQHLRIEGDLKGCSEPADPQLYDECLQGAVKRFKLRHGLKGTAILDRGTRRWLNTSVQRKILLMRLNLDRIKWLWREKAPIRIVLNIPSFRLYFYEGDHLIDTMRVIVGKPNHPTPSFHDVMKYIVVNPYWKIPESIVKKEMLRHLIRDPYYYERRGKILHASWDENSPRVDPGSVNWAKYRGKKHIPYYFMQVPGTSNALGKIKFLFPNHYSVYIHDTNQKKLFFNHERAYSHGCMRIQKPRELLKVLALYNDNIDVDAIMERLGTREKKTIALKRRVPIDITYLTAYVDPYGNLNFRKDIYHYDKYQLEHYAYNPNRKKVESKPKKQEEKK